MLQLLVPFVAGQLLRTLIGKWIERHRGVLKFVDQGSILLVVYGAVQRSRERRFRAWRGGKRGPVARPEGTRDADDRMKNRLTLHAISRKRTLFSEFY
ncbi:MAG: Sodium/bile acid symporter family [uncultured Paraburkholderia sp.]|nr:MAG: Sodium/bile acid symporter family [uncultured Paraburkholderia sp.]CAH2943893.1 MAG: Sodium/bile acid symporter family [uncultured Paraburkholderia sp.]